MNTEVSKFIISQLDELSNLFQDLELKYAYDAKTNFHIIEVSPESIRRGSHMYAECEAKIWSLFFEKFPNEDILISEPCEINNMANVICEYKSKKITEAPATSSYQFSFSPLNNITFNSCGWNYTNIAA